MNVRGKEMRGKLLAAWAGAALCAIFSLPAPGQAPQGDAPALGMGMGRGMGMAPGMGMGMGGDATAATGPPPELAGIWQRGAGNLTPVVLTEYGREKSLGTLVFDDPNTRCEGYSIPRSTLSSFGVTKIEVGSDHLVFRYEANAGTRKVYLDGRRRSEDENINGSSIGSLSGAAVHIESDGFGPEGANALMANRVQGSGNVYWLSDEFRLYERYTPIDENTLDFVMVMHDPVMLKWPRVIHARWKRLPDETPFIQGECELPERPFYLPEESGEADAPAGASE